MIGFLSIISLQRFERFEKGIRDIEAPDFETPEMALPNQKKGLGLLEEMKIPGLEFLFPSTEQNQRQNFICPAQKLKLEYPASWIKISETTLEPLKREILITEEAEILLFVNRLKFIPQTNEAASAFLVVQKIKTETKASPEIIIEKIKNWARKLEIETEIINLEIENQKALLSAKYKKTNQPTVLSRKKIIFLEDSIYLIGLIAQEEHWPKFEEEIKVIIDSIQLL